MSLLTAELSVSAMVITNAHSLTPVGAVAAIYGDTARSGTTVNVPSTTSDLVVDLLAFYAFEHVPGTGQTQRVFSDNAGNASTRMSTKPGGSSATAMSWSNPSNDPTETSQIGVSIKAP